MGLKYLNQKCYATNAAWLIKLKINLGFSRQCDALFHNLCVVLRVPKAGHTSLCLQLLSAQFNIFILGCLI